MKKLVLLLILEPNPANPYQNRVIFKPSAIIPDIDLVLPPKE